MKRHKMEIGIPVKLKFFEFKFRDGIKSIGDKIGMGCDADLRLRLCMYSTVAPPHCHHVEPLCVHM